MHHTCTHAHTQHTQTQTHGNWRCWRRPDSIVSKLGLDIPLKGGKGHSRWTSDRIFSCFWRSLYGRMSLGGMGPDGSRSWRAVYRRNSILCNNFKPECEDSEDDARASRLSLVAPQQSGDPRPCCLLFPCPPATRINRGPFWRPMFSCSLEGAAAYRGLSV